MLADHLECIIEDMRQAQTAGLYRAALLTALTLPDICNGLTLDEFAPVKKFHYIDFVDKHSVRADLGFSGSECYDLRGGMLHSGDAAWHKRVREANIIFAPPNSDRALHRSRVVHAGKWATIFNISVFCDAMAAAAWNWYAEHKSNPLVIARAKYLLRWRPDGLSPLLEGAPVFACGE